MIPNYIYPSTMNTQSYGQLLCNILSKDHRPVENATITIKEFTPLEKIIYKITTNESGKTKIVDLQAPPVEYSLEPNSPKPYSEYILDIIAPGYKPVQIKGIQILNTELAIQNVYMNLEEGKIIQIDPHTFYAEYPPKIPESEVKEYAEQPGYIALNNVVVPEIIVVHDGTPKDTTANNYYVNYKDYIKNVVSSEIYATWPQSAIEANVLAILSFTLNRFYTEWYRRKGGNYTITSSTAYDQKWSYGRNIYQNISDIVDRLFVNYISIPYLKQPLFTQYCDGVQVQCPNWLMQWGSKNMGNQGIRTVEILKYYYSQDVYINTSTKVSGVPDSFPGYHLQVNSSGEGVGTIQKQLNTISKNYPAIPNVIVDSRFGLTTEVAAKKFQEIFDMPVTGVIDYPTWYRISDVFLAITNMAKLYNK